MSDSKKTSEENKPQPAPKPISPAPRTRNLRTGYTIVTDSIENIEDYIREKNK